MSFLLMSRSIKHRVGGRADDEWVQQIKGMHQALGNGFSTAHGSARAVFELLPHDLQQREASRGR
jgi:hypothetical protein